MTKPKYYLLLLGSALVDALLLILGWNLIFLSNQLNSTVYFLAGVAALLGAVFVLTTTILRRVFYAAGFLAISLYFFLRAFGVLEIRLLAILCGLAAWLAVAILVYVVAILMNPDKRDLSEESRPP